MQLTIEQLNEKDNSKLTGKLYLVDMTGSENIMKAGLKSKVDNKEAMSFNQAVLTFGRVIESIEKQQRVESKGQEFTERIPFRDSKMTHIIAQSIGGVATTCIIITCSPLEANLKETLHSLKLGVIARKIINKPKKNRELTLPELKALLIDFQVENRGLRDRIQAVEQAVRDHKCETKIDLPEPAEERDELVVPFDDPDKKSEKFDPS
jgi:hypothetical protein